MTDIQKEFVRLDRKKDEYKKFMEQYNEVLKHVKDEIGIGGHFQDEQGIVYQIDECEGKFVHFERLKANRTKRDGERAGSLSVKKAEELGYTV